MSSRFLFFALFMAFMVLMLALDLGVFHKKDHVIKMKEAATWTGIWITLAMLFGLLLLFKAEWIHGITNMEELLAYAKSTGIDHIVQPSMEYGAALEIYRKEVFQQYLAGYFLEESLSIDNIFVMIMIFVSFGIDKRYYHRILFWGILGAIVLRFLFIFLLGTLVERVSWVLAIFGVILIYSGIKMFRDKGDEKIDTANHPAVRFASRFFPVTTQVNGHNFFTKINGRNYMTPLFLVLLVIEFSDIIFAVDSIPAVFSVTTDPFIVYFSNIFAIMGLRSLFFLLSDITDKFWLLKYGLGALLCFIGVKMIGHEFFGLSISTMASLMVILGILVFSILFSLLIPHKSKTAAPVE
ncbi:MAG: TerC/Alx family metal homeostasis membrane protein [Bacteroidales bacterium]|jgi:tellurite resistance protein TerC|nr:TerC/Alx family metal homeostasis membrane protein [Bacteroidales bacterium]